MAVPDSLHPPASRLGGGAHLSLLFMPILNRSWYSRPNDPGLDSHGMAVTRHHPESQNPCQLRHDKLL